MSCAFLPFLSLLDTVKFFRNSDLNFWFKFFLSYLKNHSACMLSCFSRVWLSVILWAVAHQAPLSMEFSRQEYWSGLPCPPPGDLPDPRIESTSIMSPALAGGFFTTSTSWETWACLYSTKKLCWLLVALKTKSKFLKLVILDGLTIHF